MRPSLHFPLHHKVSKISTECPEQKEKKMIQLGNAFIELFGLMSLSLRSPSSLQSVLSNHY